MIKESKNCIHSCFNSLRNTIISEKSIADSHIMNPQEFELSEISDAKGSLKEPPPYSTCPLGAMSSAFGLDLRMHLNLGTCQCSKRKSGRSSTRCLGARRPLALLGAEYSARKLEGARTPWECLASFRTLQFV